MAVGRLGRHVTEHPENVRLHAVVLRVVLWRFWMRIAGGVRAVGLVAARASHGLARGDCSVPLVRARGTGPQPYAARLDRVELGLAVDGQPHTQHAAAWEIDAIYTTIGSGQREGAVRVWGPVETFLGRVGRRRYRRLAVGASVRRRERQIVRRIRNIRVR